MSSPNCPRVSVFIAPHYVVRYNCGSGTIETVRDDHQTLDERLDASRRRIREIHKRLNPPKS